MRNSKSVYVVTCGQYSDQYVDAVFTTLAKAKKYESRLMMDDNIGPMIHRVILDKENFQDRKHRNSYWCVTIELLSGHIEESPFVSNRLEGRKAAPSKTNELARSHGLNVLQVVSSISVEHARKIAIEARQAHIRKQTEP